MKCNVRGCQSCTERTQCDQIAKNETNTVEKQNGLVIRYFMNGYFLCDGKAPKGHENDGEIYVGNTVKWFKTWEEANEMKQMIDASYGE